MSLRRLSKEASLDERKGRTSNRNTKLEPRLPQYLLQDKQLQYRGCACVTAMPKRPPLGFCPGPKVPLQGRQGSRVAFQTHPRSQASSRGEAKDHYTLCHRRLLRRAMLFSVSFVLFVYCSCDELSGITCLQNHTDIFNHVGINKI